MRSADASPTAELWSTTHAALCAGRWSVARSLLETLSRRPDYVDHLAPIGSYEQAAGVTLEPSFREILADRIELVNVRAERNRDERRQQGRRELGRPLLALSAALASVDADTLAARESALGWTDAANALCRAVVCAIDEIKEARAAGLLDESNWLLIIERHAADAGVSESELAATLTSGGFPCPAVCV